MKIEKTDYHDWIEKYMDSQLTEEENSKFQELLLTDSELAKQYHIRMMLAKNWTNAKDYGNTRKLISESISEAKSEKKNRLFAWSIAASFLVLLSVSGIVVFTNRTGKETTIARNSNETESPIVPQIRQAEEKASVHFMGELKLNSPVQNKLCNRNDSIVFLWNSVVDAETNFIIENQKNGKTVYREKVKLNAKKFVLEKNFLPEGEYQWYIEGFPGKEKFKVVSGEKQK